MRKAFCMIREQPHYRRDAFMAGLKAAGCDARMGPPRESAPGDVLVIWNRYGEWHDIATRFEAQGGVVVVAENGYVGPGGISPHGMEPRCWYALAIGGHNGQGTWPAGDSSRWDALGIELRPWRIDGEHIVVCPNRSFGRPGYVMPMGWAEDAQRRLRRVTRRPVRIRPHPGNDAPRTPLAADLAGAWACVIWSSSAGVQALIAGVPVICEAPAWICKDAALDEYGKQPGCDAPPPPSWCETSDRYRRRALGRLAWAQWHVDEIAGGAPFRRLLERTNDAVCEVASA